MRVPNVLKSCTAEQERNSASGQMRGGGDLLFTLGINYSWGGEGGRGGEGPPADSECRSHAEPAKSKNIVNNTV